MGQDSSEREQLHHLLNRREKYFLLDGTQRNIYRQEFEKIQRKIIRLKLNLEIYHDELDLLPVVFCYAQNCRDKIIAIEQSAERQEIRWLRKQYSPDNGYKATYIGLVLKDITDPWLAEINRIRLMNRDGMIDCPWPMKLSD